MSKMFVFSLMLFLHIVDDYYMQGLLASLKQKKWWEENYPSSLYKHDYIMALVTHGFSWAFMTMFPIVIFYQFNPPSTFWIILFVNCVLHSIIDHLKANMFKINLIQDQTLHIFQILLSFLFLVII